jgi:hypothetical protein
MLNCQSRKPLRREDMPGVIRCEYCFEPERLAFLGCKHPSITKGNKDNFEPVSGEMYLFVDVVESPDWCPLRNKNVN